MVICMTIFHQNVVTPINTYITTMSMKHPTFIGKGNPAQSVTRAACAVSSKTHKHQGCILTCSEADSQKQYIQ